MTLSTATTADAVHEPPKLSSAARMLRVLGAVADTDGPVTVRDLGRKLDLSPATAHRLLNVLRDEGFVDYVPDRRAYGVGPQFYRVAARVTQRVGPVTLAQRVAARAAAEFDETILFGLYLPKEHAMSFEARADGQKKLMYHVEMHTPVPLIWGASGKAILARLSEFVAWRAGRLGDRRRTRFVVDRRACFFGQPREDGFARRPRHRRRRLRASRGDRVV
ncbi:MAG: helix-turn-helix domain-containing protein, partial [Planctomycetota bacterium]